MNNPISHSIAFREILLTDNVKPGHHARYFPSGDHTEEVKENGNYVCRKEGAGNLVFRGKKGSFKIRLAENVVYYDYVNEAVARQVVFQCSLLAGRAWDPEQVFLAVSRNRKYVKKRDGQKEARGEGAARGQGEVLGSELSVKRMGSS